MSEVEMKKNRPAMPELEDYEDYEEEKELTEMPKKRKRSKNSKEPKEVKKENFFKRLWREHKEAIVTGAISFIVGGATTYFAGDFLTAGTDEPKKVLPPIEVEGIVE